MEANTLTCIDEYPNIFIGTLALIFAIVIIVELKQRFF